MKAKELKELFLKSGFLYPEKLKTINLDLALNNIIESYKGPDHMYYTERDNDGTLTAHLALLKVGYKTWMGHHHASIDRGAGARVFIMFSLWVAENYGKEIDHLMSFYNRNAGFYKSIYDAVDDESLCTITKVGFKPEIYQEDATYGINISNWHKRVNDLNIPPEAGDTVYNKWYFKCTKEAIDASFNFFNTL